LICQARNTASPNERLRSFVSESVACFRGDAIHHLLFGMCGKFQCQSLPQAAVLLSALVGTAPTSETESHLVAALRENYFALGDRARTVTLAVLLRSASATFGSPAHQASVSIANLAQFMNDVWLLHQTDDIDALSASDEVARFLIAYGSY
jgi:hypothetical protein